MEDKPHRCPTCGAECLTHANPVLDREIVRISWTCDICGTEAETIYGFRRHEISRKGKIEKRPSGAIVEQDEMKRLRRKWEPAKIKRLRTRKQVTLQVFGERIGLSPRSAKAQAWQLENGYMRASNNLVLRLEAYSRRVEKKTHQNRKSLEKKKQEREGA